MFCVPRTPGLLISLFAVSLFAGDARAALMQLPPVHVALAHQALLPNRVKPRIAFLQVSQNPTTKALVDQAIAALTRKGFEVLDRENIDKIIKEQKFHGGELVDLDQQVQLGKIMGMHTENVFHRLPHRMILVNKPRMVGIKMINMGIE